MSHDELVLEALAYRRNVGATIGDIRANLQCREEKKHTLQHARAALRRLENRGLLVTVGKKWFFTTFGLELARGSALDAEWRSSDAWILLAALYIGTPGQFELNDIVVTTDAINHATPTLKEMHGAINRLLAGRLLKT
jgi:hypothetical protein